MDHASAADTCHACRMTYAHVPLAAGLIMCEPLQECPKLAAWVQEASKRASVQQTLVSGKSGLSYDKYLVWVYERYADGSAKSTSAADFKD